MSASGFTPNPSPAGSSSSPATSSSHQPPAKSLRALDETASEDTPVKVLGESTDDDLVDDVAHAVPNVPDEVANEEQTPEEQYHDADDFVPRQDRAATLDAGVIAPTHPETFIIGDEEEETKQEQEEKEGEGQAAPEAKKEEAEGTSGTSAFEPVGPQLAPTPLNDLSLAASSNACASACAHSAPP